MMLFQNAAAILSATIERDVGSIIGPIVWLLGVIMNFVFNMVSGLEKNSLGVSIIIFTVIVRILMLPQGVASQKSMIKMRKIQPEVEKIKKKYGSSKDPEIQRKIAAETQALYANNKVNMLGGCLPLLITMPIFIALGDLMRRLYLYIDKVGDLYNEICIKIYEIPDWLNIIYDTASAKIPQGYPQPIDLQVPADLSKVISKFSTADWSVIQKGIADSGVVNGLNELLVRKSNIETFLGIDLIEAAGYTFPGIVIPVLSAVTSFLISFATQKMTPQMDQAVKSQQMMMMIIMPVFMFFITVSMSGGVGIYWTVSNIIALVQQIVLTKIFLNREQSSEIIVNK